MIAVIYVPPPAPIFSAAPRIFPGPAARSAEGFPLFRPCPPDPLLAASVSRNPALKSIPAFIRLTPWPVFLRYFPIRPTPVRRKALTPPQFCCDYAGSQARWHTLTLRSITMPAQANSMIFPAGRWKSPISTKPEDTPSFPCHCGGLSLTFVFSTRPGSLEPCLDRRGARISKKKSRRNLRHGESRS